MNANGNERFENTELNEVFSNSERKSDLIKAFGAQLVKLQMENLAIVRERNELASENRILMLEKDILNGTVAVLKERGDNYTLLYNESNTKIAGYVQRIDTLMTIEQQLRRDLINFTNEGYQRQLRHMTDFKCQADLERKQSENDELERNVKQLIAEKISNRKSVASSNKIHERNKQLTAVLEQAAAQIQCRTCLDLHTDMIACLKCKRVTVCEPCLLPLQEADPKCCNCRDFNWVPFPLKLDAEFITNMKNVLPQYNN